MPEKGLFYVVKFVLKGYYCINKYWELNSFGPWPNPAGSLVAWHLSSLVVGRVKIFFFADRSIAWQHFTAIAGDDSAVCNICQKVIKMGPSRCFQAFEKSSWNYVYVLVMMDGWAFWFSTDSTNILENILKTRCTTGLLNHTKRQHPAEWASGSKSGQKQIFQRKTTGQDFARSTIRSSNKRSKAWRSWIEKLIARHSERLFEAGISPNLILEMKPHAPFALERFDKEKTLEIQTIRWQK